MIAKQPPTGPQVPAAPAGGGGVHQTDATMWTAAHILSQLTATNTDLPPRALSVLAEQIHQLSRGDVTAAKLYIQQLMNAIHSAQPDQVGAALSALAWLPADVRSLIEQKIRARHAREQQHTTMEQGLNALLEQHTQPRDLARRIIHYLKQKFENLLHSGALRAAREAGLVLFHHGVANDPSHRITLSQQQELGPSLTPGMAIAKRKAQSTGVGMVRTKK